ncbi:MAG: DUF4167 domain-containing protein [Sphingomicrobium sp.]
MINNRQGGRRRGRGGQRPQGMPGGSGNRQDNRQRGNAAQLLEKYKSMARDAQLAGDRVQTEYYLQFADHYFRILGESRSRFEDQRRDRDDDGDGEDDEGAEMADAEGEAEVAERPQRRPERPRDRDDRYERQDRQDRQPRGNGRARTDGDDAEADERIAFDVLPPAIGADESPAVAPDGDSDEEAPRPRRRARRPRAEDGDAEIAPAA